MFPAAPSCVAGQPPGRALGCKLRFMRSLHAHIFLLYLMDFVVDIEPCFGSGSPDGFPYKSGRLLCRLSGLRLIQFFTGSMELFPGPVCFFLRLLEFFAFSVSGSFLLSAVCPAVSAG